MAAPSINPVSGSSVDFEPPFSRAKKAASPGLRTLDGRATRAHLSWAARGEVCLRPLDIDGATTRVAEGEESCQRFVNAQIAHGTAYTAGGWTMQGQSGRPATRPLRLTLNPKCRNSPNWFCPVGSAPQRAGPRWAVGSDMRLGRGQPPESRALRCLIACCRYCQLVRVLTPHSVPILESISDPPRNRSRAVSARLSGVLEL
jgi:hypothetical protein